jgi:hypothetical protein
LVAKIVTIDFFEAQKLLRQSLANNMTKLLDQYGLRKKIIAYVKDEDSNLNIFIKICFEIHCEM